MGYAFNYGPLSSMSIRKVSENTNLERRFLKTATKRGSSSLPRRGSQLISIVPYSRRLCAHRALPIVNSARTERGPREREKEERRESPGSARKKWTRWHSYRARENESEYMEACTNERTSERANERFGIRYYLWRGPRPAVGGEGPAKEPFLGASRQIRISLAPPSRGPSRAGPLVSPLPSEARRRLARKAAFRGSYKRGLSVTDTPAGGPASGCFCPA